MLKYKLCVYSYIERIIFKSAVGVASGNGIDIIEIIKNADSAMYADKQLFHRRWLWLYLM